MHRGPRRARPMSRHTLVLPFIAAMLLAACSRPAPAPEPVRAVRTMTVQAGSAGGAHDYAAEVRARTEVRLSFRVGGKLVQRPVNVGDVVRAGQLLARIDAQDLKLGHDAARASVGAAEVNSAQAGADFRRFKDLRDQGFISAAELERRETTLRAAQLQLDQARAQAGVQGNQAAYATLAADAAGVVTAVDAEVGAVLGAGTPVLRMAVDGPRDIVFAVPEDGVDAMRALLGRGGGVKVRLWGAAAAETLPATVREVAAAADPATRTFLIKADIGRVPVRLGQTATVVVELPPVAGISKLPLTAVFESRGQTSVWLLDTTSMSVKPQPIVVAGADGNEVVVAAGLAPGQVVVTAGVHTLTPGQKVKLFTAAAAPARPATAATPARSATPGASAASR